ncbi:MAG: acetyl-CoA carboxylase biotin carboxyl carrier protein [Clostridiales bacterium]|nr:acetyl-CoA carboxylase biotin carboxyl carrier protein [Clostridiales bacterium]
MKETDIRKYAQLMGELGLTGLEIKDRDSVVRLERTYSAAPAPAPAVAGEPVPPAAPAQKSGVAVKSPMVGVFYQAPAENAPPYVKVGDRVKPGTVLCLIEAMKMMNEITAETEGVIAEICVENGQVVDFGRELFRIER